MFTIHELPALRSLLFFSCGLLMFSYIPELGSTQLLTLTILILLISILQVWLRGSYSQRYWQGIYHACIYMLLAGLLMNIHSAGNSESFLGKQLIDGKTIFLSAEIQKDPVAGKNFSTIVESKSYSFDNSNWKRCSGKVQLYFNDSSIASKLLPGTEIIVKTCLKPFSTPKNPEEFDYKKFMASKQIYYQGFTNGNWHIGEGKLSLASLSSRWRSFIVTQIRKQLGNNEVSDVSLALLIGVREFIDYDTNQSFINTGAVHLLAVSGMHVVLIYQNLLLLFSLFITKSKIHRSKVIKVLAIILIWCFALIAGGSPSIIRAAIMLSLILFGEILQKFALSLNTLCACALVMLLFDPWAIYDVGFQLSFFAVAGIILFKPPLDRLVSTKNKWLRTFRDLITVTIAAQLGTLALVIFYFHQFPIYFLLSGLIAVIISDLCIKIGAITLILSVFHLQLDYITSKLWYFLTDLLLKVISWINQLPSPIIDQVYLNKSMLVISLILLFILALQVYQRVKLLNYLFILGFVGLLAIDFVHFIQNRNNESLTVYHIKGHQFIEIQRGFRSLCLNDSSLNQSQSKRISNNWQIENAVFFQNQIKFSSTKKVAIVSNRLTEIISSDSVIVKNNYPISRVLIF